MIVSWAISMQSSLYTIRLSRDTCVHCGIRAHKNTCTESSRNTALPKPPTKSPAHQIRGNYGANCLRSGPTTACPDLRQLFGMFSRVRCSCPSPQHASKARHLQLSISRRLAQDLLKIFFHRRWKPSTLINQPFPYYIVRHKSYSQNYGSKIELA